MRAATITDSSMLTALAGLFDTTCTIKTSTKAADSVGQMVPTPADLASHVDIPCRVAPVSAISSGGRKSLPEMVVSTTAVVIILAGDYPLITTAMKAVVGGKTYQVTYVIPDSERLCTELVAEVVTT